MNDPGSERAHPATPASDGDLRRLERAPSLVASLLALPEPERAAAAVREPYRSRSVAETLIQEADGAVADDPRLALELARTAHRNAEALDPEIYGLAAVADLAASALATEANALRVAGDLSGAERRFAEAEARFAQGSLDPLLRARLLRRWASLSLAQGRLDDARLRIRRAEVIVRWLGDRHEAGHLALTAALIDDADGEDALAAAAVRRGLSLLDPQRDRRLQLVARHNLAALDLRLGRTAAAARGLEAARRLGDEVSGRLDRIRFRWLEALLDLARGSESNRESSGQSGLLAVRDLFLAEGLLHDAALATLDLAAHHLERGRSAAARRHVEEILPLFRAERSGREALAALAVLLRSIVLETATAAAAHDVARRLRRAAGSGRAALPEPS